MFSHIMLGARDLALMGQFYDAVLAELGWRRCVEHDYGDAEGLLWRVPGQAPPEFWIQLPWNGLPATWGNGTQVSFAAPNQAAIDRAHAAALAHGGIDEGAPGLRLRYSPTYYGAYCRDPEGNKLCFVHGMG